MRAHVILLVSLVCGLLVSACTTAPMQEPVSPLPVILESPLMDQWRIESFTEGGTLTDLTSYSPIFLRFTPYGTIDSSDQCNAGWDAIYYNGDGDFRLAPGMSTAVGCPFAVLLSGERAPCAWFGEDEGEGCVKAQESFNYKPYDILGQTSHYRIDGDKLTLTGPRVSLQLVRDPRVMPWSLLGPRTIQSFTVDGQTVDPTPYGPFHVNFRRDGVVEVGDNCPQVGFNYVLDHDFSMTLTPFEIPGFWCSSPSPIWKEAGRCVALVGLDGTFAECDARYKALLESIASAVARTDRIEMPGTGNDYLRGDGVEIVLGYGAD